MNLILVLIISIQCCCAANGSQWTDNASQYNPKSIIFNVALKEMIIVGKYNKTVEYYLAESRQLANDSSYYPKILRDISSEMLAQIDGIADIFISEYLILFNIKGVPMFCTTNRNKLSVYFQVLNINFLLSNRAFIKFNAKTK